MKDQSIIETLERVIEAIERADCEADSMAAIADLVAEDVGDPQETAIYGIKHLGKRSSIALGETADELRKVLRHMQT